MPACEPVSQRFSRIRLNGAGTLPGSLDDAHRNRIDAQNAMAFPLGALDPANIVGVRGCLHGSADHAAQVVGNDVVVADALAVAVDAVEQFDEFDRLDDKPGFLQGFAGHSLTEGFAEVDKAAGNGPLAAGGLGAALDKEDAIVLDDDGAHSDQGG